VYVLLRGLNSMRGDQRGSSSREGRGGGGERGRERERKGRDLFARLCVFGCI